MTDPDYDEKASWLYAHGYVRIVNGELALSAEAVRLLTGIPTARLRSAGHDDQALLRDMRRGSAETMARVGSDDPCAVMYALANPTAGGDLDDGHTVA